MKSRFSAGTFLAGFGAGAVFAALADPRRGAARRARLRDKLTSLFHQATREAARQSRNLGRRVQGTAYELAHAGEQVDDGVLVERVRAQLGRPVAHPRAIQVSASNGEVTLSGQVLRSELDELLYRVGRIRGVKAVHNALDVLATPGSSPSLQH
ncbi:MAG TPA: BON domain-containing protein [Myxococcales bacterium]|nr:BON domain-containing protein [Myxococcales bacterium]